MIMLAAVLFLAQGAPAPKYTVGDTMTVRSTVTSHMRMTGGPLPELDIHHTEVEISTEKVLSVGPEGAWLEITLQSMTDSTTGDGQTKKTAASADSSMDHLKAQVEISSVTRRQLAVLGIPAHILVGPLGRVKAVKLPEGSEAAINARYAALAPASEAEPPPVDDHPLTRMRDATTWQHGRAFRTAEIDADGRWTTEELRPSMFKGKVKQQRTYTPAGTKSAIQTFTISGTGALTDSMMLALMVTVDQFKIEGSALYDTQRQRWDTMDERWQIKATLRAPNPEKKQRVDPMVITRTVEMNTHTVRHILPNP
ncbi:MAG: hypothetical protein ACE366_26720 [Bradymonadia bacterium]